MDITQPFILLAIGFTGLFLTIFLVVTGKKTKKDFEPNNSRKNFFLAKNKIRFFTLLYIFIYIMMLVAAIVSNFLEILIFGGIPALITIILLLVIWKKENKINQGNMI